MAKLSRNSLKALVKECLVEILAEGIGSHEAEDLRERRTAPQRQTKLRSSASRPDRKPKSNQDEKLDRVIDTTVGILTEDSIMKEILADTARTTYQAQNNGDMPGQPRSNPIASSPTGVDLAGIFDSPKNSWSDIAFSESENRATK